MQKNALELKGSSFTLSVLHLNNADIDVLLQELDHKLAQAPQFFINAPLVLNLAEINIEQLALAQLKQELLNRKLFVVGVTGIDTQFASLVQQQGLAVIKSGKQQQTSGQNKTPSTRSTKIIKQNIRSGQQVYAKDADLVVFGAVSNGAEVIADGNIHIHGSLRGKAMAGAQGDANAIIIAKTLSAELVSIAGNYWLSDNIQEHTTGSSGCIRLDGESLVIESLPA